MKEVVARRGDSEFMIADGEKGIILDTESLTQIPVNNVATVVTRGYWEPADNDDLPESFHHLL